MVFKKLSVGLLILAIILAPVFSFAGSGINRVLKDSAGNSITLLLEPCSLDILSPEAKQGSLAARLHLDGKLYKGCFKENESFVIVIDEDGDMYGPFPKEAFKPVKEA